MEQGQQQGKVVTCRRCKAEVPPEMMKRDPRYLSGLSSYCTRCHGEATRRWQREHPEELKAYRRGLYARKREVISAQRRARYDGERVGWQNVKRKYGLTKEEYVALSAKQGDKCAICERTHAGRGKRLHVDHDHETGKVRGLLCGVCNTALGAVDSVSGWMERAAAYLGGQP